jgi:uncharacterized protein YdaU (DUF1376 family)
MHYFQFEIKEWVSNTAHLSLEEEAIYLRLVNFYYDSEKPIPSDIEIISRKLRIANIQMTYAILHEFFTECESGFVHNRCDLEIAKYHAKSEQASRAGKASAEKRFNSRSTAVQPIINQESLIINHKSIIKKQIKALPTPAGVSDDLWDDFLVYRKRLKAPVTDRVLARLIKEADLAKMPLDQVLETIIFKGWRSFEASWIQQAAQKAKELPLGTDQQIEEAYRVECGGDPRLARFNSYFEMKKFIIDKREQRARV